VTRIVDNVDVIDRFRLFGRLADRPDGVIGPEIGRHRDEPWRHPAAGAVRRIGHQLAQQGGCGAIHRRERRRRRVLGQLLEHVRGVIGIHALEQVGGLVRRLRLNDLAGHGRVEVGRDLRHDLGRELLEHHRHLVGRQPRDHLGPDHRAGRTRLRRHVAAPGIGERRVDLSYQIVDHAGPPRRQIAALRCRTGRPLWRPARTRVVKRAIVRRSSRP
jgi:hypothetical protein